MITYSENTVQEYTKYRPSYPYAVIQILKQHCGLDQSSIVADIGSGTGIFSELMLQQRALVYGVEPNQAMREEAEERLNKYTSFTSIDANSDNTTLPDQSVDIITAATAFHWFDQNNAKAEFQRILKPRGWLVLVWNTRDNEGSAFMQAYNDLLEDYANDYLSARNTLTQTQIEEFYQPNDVQINVFDNHQYFDLKGLKGRIMSTSYCPDSQDAQFDNMMEDIEDVFDQYQAEGRIKFLYQTKMYSGRFSPN